MIINSWFGFFFYVFCFVLCLILLILRNKISIKKYFASTLLIILFFVGIFNLYIFNKPITFIEAMGKDEFMIEQMTHIEIEKYFNNLDGSSGSKLLSEQDSGFIINYFEDIRYQRAFLHTNHDFFSIKNINAGIFYEICFMDELFNPILRIHVFDDCINHSISFIAKSSNGQSPYQIVESIYERITQ